MSNIGRTAHLVDDSAPAEIVSERDYELASPDGTHESFALYSLQWPTGIVTNHRDSEIVIDEPEDSNAEDSAEPSGGSEPQADEGESEPAHE